jgi:hypothetical protein
VRRVRGIGRAGLVGRGDSVLGVGYGREAACVVYEVASSCLLASIFFVYSSIS